MGYPVLIHCGACKGTFRFEHPSVHSAADLMNVTLDCQHCKVTLKAPPNELHMKPMNDYLTDVYRLAGVDAPDDLTRRGVLTLVPPIQEIRGDLK